MRNTAASPRTCHARAELLCRSKGPEPGATLPRLPRTPHMYAHTSLPAPLVKGAAGHDLCLGSTWQCVAAQPAEHSPQLDGRCGRPPMLPPPPPNIMAAMSTFSPFAGSGGPSTSAIGLFFWYSDLPARTYCARFFQSGTFSSSSTLEPAGAAAG